MVRLTLPICLMSLGLAFAESLSLNLSSSMETYAEKATELIMKLQYNEALSVAQQLKKTNEGVGCVIESIDRKIAAQFSFE